MTLPNYNEDAQLKKLLTEPGLTFMEVRHDGWCPALTSGGNDCQCSPTIAVHRDEARFVQGEIKSRQERRKAAREAAKATQKAKGGQQ
jgi:hypothetical protein